MEQLKEYNGKGPDGRVLVAVNGKIFDVTKGNSLLTNIEHNWLVYDLEAKYWESKIQFKISSIHNLHFLFCSGKRFYGPEGPYAAFAGRDASRGLATFSVSASDEYDDLTDLNAMQRESVNEWEAQFTGN